ncbi:MAG: hypothetical protein ACLR56_03130 [Oscillospiraceae bacterium]
MLLNLLKRQNLIETLDNAVGNVLRVKLRLGLFEHPFARNMKLIKPNISDTQGSLPERAWFCLKTKTMFCRLKKTNAWHWGPMATIKETHLGTWTLDGDENDVTSIAEAMKAVGGNRVNAITRGLPINK